VAKRLVPRVSLGMVAAASLTACATTISVVPPLGNVKAVCRLHATISYDGKPDYLPAALIADTIPQSSTTVRYTFEAQYGLKETNAFLALVNPLTLFGFPTGSGNLVVTGRVDFLRGQSVVRSYGAAASLERASNVFSEGETFTELRRRGLLLVRDNLTAQLCKDERTLQTLLAATDAPQDHE
jgi:hypothetical protein